MAIIFFRNSWKKFIPDRISVHLLKKVNMVGIYIALFRGIKVQLILLFQPEFNYLFLILGNDSILI